MLRLWRHNDKVRGAGCVYGQTPNRQILHARIRLRNAAVVDPNEHVSEVVPSVPLCQFLDGMDHVFELVVCGIRLGEGRPLMGEEYNLLAGLDEGIDVGDVVEHYEPVSVPHDLVARQCFFGYELISPQQVQRVF
eukprot:6230134-Ditylum_brightwellii.AAC.1